MEITYYINQRTANVRNLSVSAVNGLVSLIILLIAPLGLLAVIVNTALVMAFDLWFVDGKRSHDYVFTARSAS